MESETEQAGARQGTSNNRPTGMSQGNRRLVMWSVAFLVLASASLYILYSIEQYLIQSPTFAIRGGAGDSGQPTLHISGTQHSSLNAIEAVFAEDMGRSLYLVPLEERLTTLRTVDWVRGATVSRIWPNRLIVQVEEREPVAFVTLPDASSALIDADGEILPTVPDRFELPVLRGVSAEAPVEDRREAIVRMNRITEELAGRAAEISEIDVSDLEKLSIAQSYEGRMLTLILGDRNFGVRYQNFLDHYDEIRERLPGVTVLDLRLEDRITVVR